MIRFHLGTTLAGLAAALTAATLTASTTLAHEMRAGGAPPDLASGHGGYYVWNDGHELHLRVSDGEASTAFRATLRTDGKFVDLAHDGDQHDEHAAISDDGHVLHFRAMPGTDLDGFRVHVQDSTRVNLQLKRDGDSAPTGQIWLGSEDEHPDSSSFSLRI